MLFINNKYESLNRILSKDIINETLDSDKFESKCARYLRKHFPGHKFTLKGGNNRTMSDILVDDTFYIECKMTENGNKKVGAQSTGFGIKLIEDGNNKFFECSETAADNEAASEIMSYINSNFDRFIKLVEPHSSKVMLDLDKSIFAKWISNYYKNKGVEFFITAFNNEYAIFKNTARNLLKYFDIYAFARYYSNGSKNLPLTQRDEIIAGLKKQCRVSSVKFNDMQSIVKINGLVENPYFDINDTTIYLSDKDQAPNEYRVMKISGAGSPRILFSLYTKSNQDMKDLAQFERFLNKV